MPTKPANFENRLDGLRAEAKANGTVNGAGLAVVGGPIPDVSRLGPKRDLRGASENNAGRPGYFGKGILKPPVWTWEIALYFFVGGLGGMAGVIAAPAWFSGHADIQRAAMWLAAAGGVLTPVLLIMDLGRPKLFLHMLRVFKPQSPMSVGTYIVSAFGTFAIPGALLVELAQRRVFGSDSGFLATGLHVLSILLTLGTAFWGMFLATYTGVLIAVTSVPVWFTHKMLLPFHFGFAGLGCAVGALELLGFYWSGPLGALGFLAATVETGVLLWLLLRRHGASDRALHEGLSGRLLLPAEILTGPVSLLLRVPGFWVPGWRLAAAVAFLVGALMNRFGWVFAGHASAHDPEAPLAAQRRALG